MEGFSRVFEKVETAVETAQDILRIMQLHVTLEIYLG